MMMGRRRNRSGLTSMSRRDRKKAAWLRDVARAEGGSEDRSLLSITKKRGSGGDVRNVDSVMRALKKEQRIERGKVGSMRNGRLALCGEDKGKR